MRLRGDGIPAYPGERHVIVARELPPEDGNEWVEFEEVPGPDPKPLEPLRHRGDHPIASRLDVMFVKAAGIIRTVQIHRPRSRK